MKETGGVGTHGGQEDQMQLVPSLRLLESLGPPGPLWGREQLCSLLGKPLSQLLLPSEALGAPGSQLDHSLKACGEGRKPAGDISPSPSHRALQNPTNGLALQMLIHFCERTVFGSVSSNKRASMSISLYEKTHKIFQNFHKTRG